MKQLLSLLLVFHLCSCGNSNADEIKLYTDSVGIVQSRLAQITDSTSAALAKGSIEIDAEQSAKIETEKKILNIKREMYLQKIEELKK